MADYRIPTKDTPTWYIFTKFRSGEIANSNSSKNCVGQFNCRDVSLPNWQMAILVGLLPNRRRLQLGCDRLHPRFRHKTMAEESYCEEQSTALCILCSSE
ncbi:hypothetical protein NECAME_03865 [Necator americanus]|uniref:Uncharacterized protein n=1 Tax=Necator americanus TaxID=51031 RepID=W2SZ21_NECAM|nr:hypothetical protein NECAME_03865 [Necator americanus]ETN74950.1 hypothetical protein NECAME_03865 [Necator americanus]